MHADRRRLRRELALHAARRRRESSRGRGTTLRPARVHRLRSRAQTRRRRRTPPRAEPPRRLPHGRHRRHRSRRRRPPRGWRARRTPPRHLAVATARRRWTRKSPKLQRGSPRVRRRVTRGDLGGWRRRLLSRVRRWMTAVRLGGWRARRWSRARRVVTVGRLGGRRLSLARGAVFTRRRRPWPSLRARARGRAASVSGRRRATGGARRRRWPLRAGRSRCRPVARAVVRPWRSEMSSLMGRLRTARSRGLRGRGLVMVLSLRRRGRASRGARRRRVARRRAVPASSRVRWRLRRRLGP